MIEFKNVNYTYKGRGDTSVDALKDINIKIDKNEFIGIIGHTGSGKSTFLQHMNALIKPQEGEVIVDGISTSGDRKNLIDVRKKVGLVFQYPEYQLFEETIKKDIEFGPKNLGYKEEELEEIVRNAMDMVNLSYEEMKDISPFEISGGQQRRVAIAGVLAMRPRYLVLDEPTAGLDPSSRDVILNEIYGLYERDEELTVILVSHSMEDIAKYANRIIALDKGQVILDGDPKDVFSKRHILNGMGLGIPQITEFMQEYKKLGNDVDDRVLNVDDAYIEMKRYLGDENG